MKNIRAIVFDFGGVLSTNDDIGDIGRHLSKKYRIAPDIVSKITLRGWMKARINPKHDAVFWSDLARALNISEARLHKEYLTFPQFLPDTARLVRKLRKRYVVGMLSNQIETWHLTLMKKWRLEGLFNPMITSYEEGVAKPDPKIYKRLLKKLKIPANECAYIDDRDYNLPPAKKLGMHTILFKTPAQLTRELKKMGVEF